MNGTVQKWGNSSAVRIPGLLAKELGLGVGARVVLRRVRGGLLVKPAKPKVRLADILAKCKGPNPHREAWKEPAGKEIL